MASNVCAVKMCRASVRRFSVPPATQPKWCKVKAALQATPIWRQYREFELHPEDQSSWSGPNVVAVLEAFQSSGFDIVHTRSWGDRVGFRARVGFIPERLLKHTYEGCPENAAVVGLHATDVAGTLRESRGADLMCSIPCGSCRALSWQAVREAASLPK